MDIGVGLIFSFAFNSELMNTSKAVIIWLYVGLVMVFIQVIVGGITRLTESGLSITKWEVVSGTIPPLNSQDWEEEFSLYKETPQYKEINEGMSLSQFKFIYFWEYIHRFWARLMGFVFIIPFLIFLRNGKLSAPLLKNLGIVFLLAVLAATFGWIMVASGLITRPWVNAYKLSIHLSIAFAVFGYLQWTYLSEKYKNLSWNKAYPGIVNLVWIFLVLYSIQVFLGGMMSGMKIAVVYPEWPTMNGDWFPSALGNLEEWTLYNLHHYDTNEFAPAFVHFFHRNMAFLLLIFFGFLLFKYNKMRLRFLFSSLCKNALWIMAFALIIQVFLGISTVLLSVGKIPVWIGVAHQAGALFLLASIIYFIFGLKKDEN